MTILHPHWQPTDDPSDASPDRGQRTEDRGTFARSPLSVSRRPAAVLGILMVLSIGAVLLQDSTALPGALTGDAVTITVTAEGFDPETTSARPGQTIVWKNDSTIPHIIAVETLLGSDGKAMQTSPIFPESSGEVTIPIDAPEGSYTYLTQTALFTGTITIEAPESPTTDAPPTPPLADAPSALPLSLTNDDAAPPPSVPLGATLLPKNPHTVGSEPSLPSLSPKAGTPPAYAAATKPRSTPETGSALWVVSLLSVAILLLLTRRCFARA